MTWPVDWESISFVHFITITYTDEEGDYNSKRNI